jgi:hypothetical protein
MTPKGPLASVTTTSASRPKADIGQQLLEVRYVPKPEVTVEHGDKYWSPYFNHSGHQLTLVYQVGPLQLGR